MSDLSPQRRGRITASKAGDLWTVDQAKAMINGEAEYPFTFLGTGLSMIEQKAHQQISENIEETTGFRAKAVDWGHRYEPMGLTYFKENILNHAFEQTNWFPLEIPITEDISAVTGATPDFLVEGGVATGDVKCPITEGKIGKFKRKVISETLDVNWRDAHLSLLEWNKDYYFQQMWQMLCVGCRKGYLVYFDPRYINSETGKLTKHCCVYRYWYMHDTIANHIKDVLVQAELKKYEFIKEFMEND